MNKGIVEKTRQILKDYLDKHAGPTAEHESPYAAPGGGLFGCMYCGTRHSSHLECRPPCSAPSCTWRGIPWQVEGGSTAPLCMRHKPENGKPLPVLAPKSEG